MRRCPEDRRAGRNIEARHASLKDGARHAAAHGRGAIRLNARAAGRRHPVAASRRSHGPMERSTNHPTRPPATPEGGGFAAIAHQILIRERRRPMRDVAAALGLSYAALHARVSGRVPFSPMDINLLLHEMPDVRLVDALLRHTRFVAFEKPHPARSGGGATAIEAATAALRNIAALVEDLAGLAEGRRPPGDGDAAPEARLEEAQRAIAALAFALPQVLAAQRRRAAPPDADPGASSLARVGQGTREVSVAP
jgi:hypothetical protein